MPSPFAAALAQAEAAIDQHMGETVQITPMRPGEFARLPDAERPAFDVTALVVPDDPSGAAIPKLDARHVTEQWSIEVRRTLLAGRRVMKGDEIVLLDQPGGPRVVVNHVERLDAERVLFVCGPVSD